MTLLGVALLTLTGGRAHAGIVVDFSADTAVSTTNGIVMVWGDQSGSGFDAVTASQDGPVLTTAIVNGRSRPVLRFNGNNFMTAPPHVPATGTLFLVFSYTGPVEDRRVIGWEDSAGGSHGIGIVPNNPYGVGELLVVARESGAEGDVRAEPGVSEMEVVTLSWGSSGVALERRFANGQVLTFSNPSITSVSDGGYVLHIGAPGDYDVMPVCQPFQGDVAALRVYDEQLSAADRAVIGSTLSAYWLGLGFAGTPGQANCHGKSVSALPPRVKGGLKGAASALGFESVTALQDAIRAYCGN